jgi:hypothetical protein
MPPDPFDLLQSWRDAARDLRGLASAVAAQPQELLAALQRHADLVERTLAFEQELVTRVIAPAQAVGEALTGTPAALRAQAAAFRAAAISFEQAAALLDTQAAVLEQALGAIKMPVGIVRGIAAQRPGRGAEGTST